MASFYDKGDVGPNTDPEPRQGDGQFDDQHFIDTLFDGLEDDQYNQREPGLGGEFDGNDPSIWSHTGQAEEPDEQGSATPPVLSSEGAEMLKEIREAELLALRGIHLPTISVPWGVDPATGEILTPDDSIATFQESVAELEAIMAEVVNADLPQEPVADLVDLPAELIAEIAAQLVAPEGVVESPVDDVADVAHQSALSVIVSDILRYIEAVEQYNAETEPWWADNRKLKRFLGIAWDGFLSDTGELNMSAFSINNPTWMSPDTKWDQNVPWWMKFESAFAPASYQWFTGEYGMSMEERFGEGRTNRQVGEDLAFAAAIDSDEDLFALDDPLSDTIFSALADFSDQFGGSMAQISDIAAFNIDEPTGEWDDGLI